MTGVLLFLIVGLAAAQQSTNNWPNSMNSVAGKTIQEISVEAEKGDATAQATLGFDYLYGRGVKQDIELGVKWIRKAAGQGDAGSQHNLGYIYANGLGVATNSSEAFKWYRTAAEQGFSGSQFEVGARYNLGLGVTQDFVEGVKWLTKSAEQGYASAQNNLGACYQNGDGVAKDYIEAYKWFNLALAQVGDAHGLDAAKFNLSIIERLMTAEQVAEAQRLVREFKPRKKPNSGNSSSLKESLEPFASGTGFFITGDGYLISNHHVVKGGTKVRLVTSVGLIDAKVVKVDAANDLALLKAEGRFAALPIAPSRAVKLGGTVATVGFPNIGLQGFAPKFARGEIASLSGAGDDARYFQISVPVQPGNSGGALVDERGNVVGVVSAKLNAAAALASSGALPENVNYAVKSSYLLSFLESVPDVSAKLKTRTEGNQV